jgi:hypothetical protein
MKVMLGKEDKILQLHMLRPYVKLHNVEGKNLNTKAEAS